VPVHETVKKVVDERGLSTAELVAKTGWSEQRVWRLLTGRTDIHAEDMRVFARVLDKSVAELYGEAAAS
jgi:hypothetical protein